jgi:hypothetical protein
MIMHNRRGNTLSRTRIGKSKVPELYVQLVEYRTSYLAGYAPNGQYYSGLTDQREAVEKRSISARPSAADSVCGADLTALRIPLP